MPDRLPTIACGEAPAPPPSDRLGQLGRAWAAVLLLALFVALAYGARLATLTIRGEEPRRAQIAREMAAGGDWVVPRLQGQPFLSRPPLHAWAIAAAAAARGELDAVAIRLPSVLAVLLTTVLLFAYGRQILTGLGAWSTALAFASMAQVLELGRLGETEALLTLWVAAALLTWHWALVVRGRPLLGWVGGYLFAALGVLTKGAPAIGFFAAAVVLHLMLTRRGRLLLTRDHALGLAAFAALVLLWSVPFQLSVDRAATIAIWWQEIAIRFTDTSARAVVGHLVRFPGEIALATLPWSPLLLCFLDRRLRRVDDDASDAARCAAVAFAAGFVVCWLVPGAHERYLMPLYPCLAVLVGVAVERCHGAAASELGPRLLVLLGRLLAATMVVCGTLVAAGSFIPSPASPWAQPPRAAFAYVVVCVAAAAVVWWSGYGRGRARWLAGVAATALFMAWSFTGVFVTKLAGHSADVAGMIGALRGELPADARLVSVGPVDALFAFHWAEPIERVDDVDATELCAPEVVVVLTRPGPALPIALAEIATIPLRRSLDHPDPRAVVVGRCTAPPSAPPPPAE